LVLILFRETFRAGASPQRSFHFRSLPTPISKVAEEAKKNDRSDEARISLIDSCTNSSYADMTRSASIVKQAQSTWTRLQEQVPPYPGSEQVCCHYRSCWRVRLRTLRVLVASFSLTPAVLALASGIGKMSRRAGRTLVRHHPSTFA
jgi:hypothetical protein